MNMPAVSSPFAFPKLDGSNYTSWKEDMKVVLMDRGCWNFIIEEDKPCPEQATEKEKFEYDWRKQRCYTTIYQGIERKFLPLIRHTPDEIPVPYPPSSLVDIQSDSEDGETLPHQDESSSDFSVEEGSQPFSQSELNDLVRDLDLSKHGAELLGSRLKNKILMSLKVHFLHSHIGCFPDHLRAYSEEQGERFHQDVRDIKRRYQGRWDFNMLADYCWMLRREREDGRRKLVRRSAKRRKKVSQTKRVNML
ncbi:hypothetical protein AVEN_229987-1 [Araneus ventricosus]|uniref:DUF4219 domain-containing protein n=1 Tax=Araneus ventricosus TaxID=182803 RepID=A0A4Y2VC04_ARAVE|nr:hypothetical protein AVEN_229987-1 [Araneus ventricosus]